MVRPIPLVMVAVLLTAGGYPAQAEQPFAAKSTFVTVKVPIGDLDLSQPAGADTLLKRASHAASRACGGIPRTSVFVVVESRAYRECKAKAMSQAVAELDAPLVTARFAQGSEAQNLRLAQAR